MAQGGIGPVPEILKHRGMLALQRSSLEHFLRVLPCDGLSVINPPPKRTQLDAGGGHVRLRCNQGGGHGPHASQPHPTWA